MQSMVALGVAGTDGDYQEVTGGGYARAVAGMVAHFGPATATWGVVRGIAKIEDDGAVGLWWVLPVPVLIQAGESVVYDDHAVSLTKQPASATAPTATAPILRAKPTPTLRGGKR